MAILVVLALLVLGAFVVVLPALVQGIIIGAVGLLIYRSVMRHHHAA